MKLIKFVLLAISLFVFSFAFSQNSKVTIKQPYDFTKQVNFSIAPKIAGTAIGTTTDGLKWDGGSTGLNASTGRASLGLGTASQQNSGAFLSSGDTLSAAQIDSIIHAKTKIWRLAFIVDSTANGPVTGDSVVTHPGLIGKHVEVWIGSDSMERLYNKSYISFLDGYVQPSYEFDSELGKVTFHPPFTQDWTAHVIIEATDTARWEDLAFAAPSEPEVVDSYSEASKNDQMSFGGGAFRSQVAQSFTTVAGTLTSVKFYLTNISVDSGNFNAVLYAHSGSYGSTSVPTGSALATSDNVAYSVLATAGDYSLVEFTFSGANQYAMSAGNYCIAVEYTGASTGYAQVGSNNTGTGHDGNESWYNGDWSELSLDAIFYVYGIPD